MLHLDSPRWNSLTHAYGSGQDIPPLLQQLAAHRHLPPSEPEDRTWHALWDRLEHQFTVYDASYAAIPHLIQIAQQSPHHPRSDYFLLPAAIEVRRALGYGEPFPADLTDAYHHAIQQVPQVVALFVTEPWDAALSRSIAAALAVAKGHILLADIVMDLRPEAIEEYYLWRGWTYHHGNPYPAYPSHEE
jgi:hypothetical protein